MNDFDRIINAEKTRGYHLADRDQFVFDTITDIQSQNSNTVKWILLSLLSVLTIIAVVLQLLVFQSASFSNLERFVQQLLTQQPYYLAVLNVSVIGAILVLKKLRLFA